VAFDEYARESDLADSATGAKGASEESIAKVIILEERRKLGIVASDDAIVVDDDE
jgi:hypothetical protein